MTAQPSRIDDFVIDFLRKEKDPCESTTIAENISEHYHTSPDFHNFLSDHLQRMTENGLLVKECQKFQLASLSEKTVEAATTAAMDVVAVAKAVMTNVEASVKEAETGLKAVAAGTEGKDRNMRKDNKNKALIQLHGDVNLFLPTMSGQPKRLDHIIIDFLRKKEPCESTTIAEYILENYLEPQDFQKLLSEELEKLTVNGLLMKDDGNFRIVSCSEEVVKVATTAATDVVTQAKAALRTAVAVKKKVEAVMKEFEGVKKKVEAQKALVDGADLAGIIASMSIIKLIDKSFNNALADEKDKDGGGALKKGRGKRRANTGQGSAAARTKQKPHIAQVQEQTESENVAGPAAESSQAQVAESTGTGNGNGVDPPAAI